MLPPKKTVSPQQRELLDLFARLDADNRDSLLAFAAFLLQRQGESPSEPAALPTQPLQIPRPNDESVVAAIRRLSQTYPMLNKDELLHQASNLMSAHVLHGQSAQQVVDELEALFAKAYERYAAENA